MSGQVTEPKVSTTFLRTTGPSTMRSGWSAAPHDSATQWTGQMPPSLEKWGVDAGWRSCVYTTNAPADRAATT